MLYLFYKYYIDGDWGLGIGDWGLGIGDWAQSPIPNPQQNIFNLIIYIHIKRNKFYNFKINYI